MDKQHRQWWILIFIFFQNYWSWTFKEVFTEIARKLNARELKYMLLYGDLWKCQRLTSPSEAMQKDSSVKCLNNLFISLKELTALNIASYWVTWSFVCPASSGGLKSDLPQWKGLCSPSLCLEVKVLRRREIAREKRQNVLLMLVFTSSPVLFFSKNIFFLLRNIFAETHLKNLHIFCQFHSNLFLALLILSLHNCTESQYFS